MPNLTVENVGTFVVPAGKRLINALSDECGSIACLRRYGPLHDLPRGICVRRAGPHNQS